MNADLMLNNIYMSGEFAPVNDDQEQPQTQKKEQDEPNASPPLLKGRLDSKSSFDMKEAEASIEQSAVDTIEVARQIDIRATGEMTPVTINATSHNDLVGGVNVSEIQLAAKQQNESQMIPTQQKKNISQQQITRDLDVETNYLRNSAQGFNEEMQMKTVFSKRGPQIQEDASKFISEVDSKQENVDRTLGAQRMLNPDSLDDIKKE